MNHHPLILRPSRWMAFICCVGLAFLVSWPSHSAAKQKKPGYSPLPCTCFCAVPNQTFGYDQQISSTVACSQLEFGKCRISYQGVYYDGNRVDCRDATTGQVLTPPTQVPPTQRPGVAPLPGAPVPPPATQ